MYAEHANTCIFIYQDQRNIKSFKPSSRTAMLSFQPQAASSFEVLGRPSVALCQSFSGSLSILHSGKPDGTRLEQDVLNEGL